MKITLYFITARQNDQTPHSWGRRPHGWNRPGQIAHLITGEEAEAVRQGSQRREDDLAEDKWREGSGDERGKREGNKSD